VQLFETQCGLAGSLQSSSVVQPTHAPVPPEPGRSHTKAAPNLMHCEPPAVSHAPQVSVLGLHSGTGDVQSVMAKLRSPRQMTQVPLSPDGVPFCSQWRPAWLLTQAVSPATPEQGPQVPLLQSGAALLVQSADALLERHCTHWPCCPVAAVSQFGWLWPVQPALPVHATHALLVHCGALVEAQSLLATHCTHALMLHLEPTVLPVQLASLEPHDPQMFVAQP
jgi:hypothetical protein